MKVVSFNYRGSARPNKKLALQRLIYATPIDFIFLQETLRPTESITHLLESMFPSWTFIGLDANGQSGGISLQYNKRSINITNYWGGIGTLWQTCFQLISRSSKHKTQSIFVLSFNLCLLLYCTLASSFSLLPTTDGTFCKNPRSP